MFRNAQDLSQRLKFEAAPAPETSARLTRKPEAFYTGGNSTCCIAVNAGFRRGAGSHFLKNICPKHPIDFLVNTYRYRHAEHMAAIAAHHPAYATVRDMMTPEQCARDGIEYYPPEQLLDFAREAQARGAGNVIVIPKHLDYLAQVPAEFVVGLPVPSSFGVDVLPLEAYRGRRIHLLGGTWARALSYLYLLGDDVVSMDMNSMQLLAKSGLFVDPAGETHSLKDTLPFSTSNTLAIAFAISCGSIQHALASLVHSA